MTPTQTPPRFLPWLVWGAGIVMYVFAIVNRTSLSALGPTAQEHFNIGAATLSSFGVLQLIVYAGMQIPVGVLLDRFGVTRVLVVGGVTMVLGQTLMAFADHVSVAIIARMLVGAGDAGVFISVMRMLPDWFPARQLPMMGQITGVLGNLGQTISLFPLSMAVGAFGWLAGFAGVAVSGIFVVFLCAVTLRDTPGKPTVWEGLTGRRGGLTERATLLLEDGKIGLASLPSNTGLIDVQYADERRGLWKVLGNLKRVLTIPGVRLAFWVHFTAPFALHIFLLLWGTPLLVGGFHMSQAEASSVLMSMVLVAVVAGPVYGRATSRFQSKRLYFVIASILLIALSWAMVLAWPGTPPLWTLFLATTLTATGGAASMVSFELVRAYAPRRFIGLATGAANMGGFIAALIGMFFIGVVLDLLGAGSPETYNLQAFKIAFATQFLLWIPGLIAIFVEMRNTKRWNTKHRPGQ